MRRLTPLWIFILLAAAGTVYLPGFSKYLKLKRKEAELERQIHQLQDQIAQIRKEEHLLKTDLTRLEEVVREELGLVKPGETVIKVVEEEVPDQQADETKKSDR